MSEDVQYVMQIFQGRIAKAIASIEFVPQFTDSTGFTEMYIMKECAKEYAVVFALQKYSIFRSKFGYLIGRMQVVNCIVLIDQVFQNHSFRKLG